ncbi:MAG: hypothetical protein AAGK09_09835 [Planctomycetota bacterium]
MLTAARLESLTDVADADRLIDGLGRSGLPLSLTQRVRLASSPSCCAALALRRLAEITFGPTRLSRRLTRSLLSRQQPDGSWESDPLATACAVAALQRIVAEHRADDAPRLAMRRGEWALASMQRPDGLLVGTADREEDAAASMGALILYLLDRVDTAWEAVRRTDLAACVQSRVHRLAEAERLLLEMAIPAGESGERRRPEASVAGGDRHETGVVAMPPRMEPVVSTVAA